MENKTNDYQVIRFHRGRPDSITSERENNGSRDLDDNQPKKSNAEESTSLKGNQNEGDKPLIGLEK